MSANYNTATYLWINELELMKQEKAAPLVVADGHIFRSNNAIARFDSTEKAVNTLRQAGFADSNFSVRS